MAAVVIDVSAPLPQLNGDFGRIPIRNLWLLMLYASDLFRAKGHDTVSLDSNPDDLPDLVAEILARAVEVRLRRRLGQGFRLRSDNVNRVRGRIEVLRTECHQLLAKGMVACRFDELTIDTPRNRYVRGALESICRIVRREDVLHRCRSLANGMKSMGVSGDVPTQSEMAGNLLGRQDVEDRLMMAAARLAYDLLLPTQTAGANRLWLPDREEAWVRRLFERAVGGLLDVAMSPLSWTVKCGKPLAWQISKKSGGIDRVLPSMRTDIVLEHAPTSRRIVIDTKFTSILVKGWYKDETLRSGYLYQIYAYLQSQTGQGDPLADSASGVLLHPSVGDDVDETAQIQGHAIRFATVDLMAQASEIRKQVLRVCEPGLA